MKTFFETTKNNHFWHNDQMITFAQEKDEHSLPGLKEGGRGT